MKSTHIFHFLLAFFTKTTFANHSGYWISLMWPALSSFFVSSFMTYRLSLLNFLLLWWTGLTWGSMVRRWHRKSGSMSGMSDADHAKASICHVMTSTIWSYAARSSDLPSLNVLPPISLSRTSPASSGRLSRAIFARTTPSLSGALVVTMNTLSWS